MTPSGADAAGRVQASSIIRFEDFETSWAGPTSIPGAYCFGSDDGRLKYATAEGLLLTPSVQAVGSGDPINGFANIDPYLAISTRSEVAIIQIPSTGAMIRHSLFHGGAHNVIATCSGRFVAPLGPRGLLAVSPRDSDIQEFRVGRLNDGVLDFYKVASISALSGVDVVACALRRDGLGAAYIGESDRELSFRSWALPGLDIIDVCGLGTADWPLAVAALSLDGTVLLSRDASTDIKPLSLRLGRSVAIEGRGYRLMKDGGNLILLTSEILYILKDIVALFLADNFAGTSTNIIGYPLHAVDIGSAGPGRLFVIMPDSILVFDVDQLSSAHDETTDQRVQLDRSPIAATLTGDPVPGWGRIIDHEMTFAAVG